MIQEEKPVNEIPSWVDKTSPDYDPPRILEAVQNGIRLVEVQPPLIGFWANYFAHQRWKKEHKTPPRDPLADCKNGKHVGSEWTFKAEITIYDTDTYTGQKTDLPIDRQYIYTGKCRFCEEPMMKKFTRSKI